MGYRNAAYALRARGTRTCLCSSYMLVHVILARVSSGAVLVARISTRSSILAYFN